MAYIQLESSIPGVSVGAWKIEEEELFFLERVKLYENEWQRLARIVHPQKRLEWLSSRLCLKELIQISNSVRVESLNAISGKPYLSNNPHKISYTHSTRYSAAIASLNGDVGIDIEYLNRKRNLDTRFLFMNEEELAFFEANQSFELFILIWSAKETVYKIHGEGTGFKHNITLELENCHLESNGRVPAIVQKDGLYKVYDIYYIFQPEFLLTYTCDLMYVAS